ncbi:MAG: GntR family transcriptional regulator, L-lactate dehydrogenase operon regulator [Thermoleophilaceae bacterium]|jgi:DNA-binding FadR family transcriptional regulator|nr:GntR family transcriptional regulator, L-lactate dehydrogenase operon regulator [Thermoleophilaceae bacterium]
MSDIAVATTGRIKIYEDIAGELRGQILRGELTPGERLPRESAMAERYGVSRATVREALRVCAGQDLIHTAEGSAGGSFVARPSSGRVSDSLRNGLDLLTGAQEISVDDLLEMRTLLEVPAARLAALRRSDEDVDRLAASSPVELLELGATDQFHYNEEFHSILIEASGNVLLSIAARPIFAVLQRNLGRSALEPSFHRSINDQHHRISAAIGAGDPDRAEREMVDHLSFLGPFYARAWNRVLTAAEGA